MASSTRTISNRCGATSSTGSIARCDYAVFTADDPSRRLGQAACPPDASSGCSSYLSKHPGVRLSRWRRSPTDFAYRSPPESVPATRRRHLSRVRPMRCRSVADHWTDGSGEAGTPRPARRTGGGAQRRLRGRWRILRARSRWQGEPSFRLSTADRQVGAGRSVRRTSGPGGTGTGRALDPLDPAQSRRWKPGWYRYPWVTS